ncbi:MAG TPA: hypothetical protein VJC16_03320, partial [Candidatus Nanoarchaeia archaeon]|nr:hypothetical protein [Candidatus Nanoarchaeia archaeon]
MTSPPDWRKRMAMAREQKQLLMERFAALDKAYETGSLSAEELRAAYERRMQGRDFSEWMGYYDLYIAECRKHSQEALFRQALPWLAIALLGVVWMLGYHQAGEGREVYVERLGIITDSSRSYLLSLQGPPESFRLSGQITGRGDVQVYLGGVLVLDMRDLQAGRNVITGYVVSNETNGTAENGTQVIVFNDLCADSCTLETNETNLTLDVVVNGTTVNLTHAEYTVDAAAAEERSIRSHLRYHPGTLFDADDDGIENLSGVIDFAVSADFSWQANESLLCTRYWVEPAGGDSSFLCYGNAQCCSLAGLAPTLEQWDDPLNVFIGRYGAAENNTVRAQVLFADYGTDYSNIYYSGWDNLSAVFTNKTALAVHESNISAPPVLNRTVRQFGAVLGKPVRWTQRIVLREPGRVNVTLPEETINVTVKKIKDGREEDISGKAHVGKGKQEVAAFNEEGLAKITGNAAFGSQILAWIRSLASITGFASAEAGDAAELVIEEAVAEIEIEYFTEGPSAAESGDEYQKRITITAPLNYSDILSFTSLPDVPASAVQLYWHATEEDYQKYVDSEYRVTGSGQKIRVDITASEAFGTSFADEDGNGLMDMVYWVTPHTSEQEYEVSIVLLNLKSHPQLGSNWTVSFNTTGFANLSIMGIDGTAFGEDLLFEELRCGGDLVDAVHEGNSVFVENYSCSGVGTHRVQVITTGSHFQLF